MRPSSRDYFLVLLIGLLFWPSIKAGLVGWYFMHLKFEGNWVYIMIVPAFILATIIVLALHAGHDAQGKPRRGFRSEYVPSIRGSVCMWNPLDRRMLEHGWIAIVLQR